MLDQLRAADCQVDDKVEESEFGKFGWVTDLEGKVLDACLQLHGGYGFMWEFPIARAWADSRIHRIYAGTNEIMKEIVARTL